MDNMAQPALDETKSAGKASRNDVIEFQVSSKSKQSDEDAESKADRVLISLPVAQTEIFSDFAERAWAENESVPQTSSKAQLQTVSDHADLATLESAQENELRALGYAT